MNAFVVPCSDFVQREMPTTMLEVCVDTFQGAKIAAEAGADRIELCSVLDVGGLTPAGALVSSVRHAIELPLIVLIRSCPGGFVYCDEEC